MSKTISFKDLQMCAAFSGLNEIEMLSPTNDKLMAWALDQVGFDIEYPISYIPRVHRCMKGTVALGFMVVGEINLNRKYIDSPLCTLTERMIAAAYTDPSLTQEMGNLLGMRVNFRSLLERSPETGSEHLPEDMLEPDRDWVGQQIRALEDLRDSIRGDYYNDRGEAKTFEEVAQGSVVKTTDVTRKRRRVSH